MSLKVLGTIGLLAGLIGFSVEGAVPIFDSLTGGYDSVPSDGDPIFPYDGVSTSNGADKVGYRFATGTGTPTVLQYDVKAAVFSETPPNSATIDFQLWSAGANTPNIQISDSVAKTTGDPSSANILNATLTLSAPLQDNTSYYLVFSYVSSSPPGFGAVAYASTATYTHRNIAYYFNGGWNSYIDSGTTAATTAAFSITPVPEPQTYAMVIGSAMLAFGVFRSFLPKQHHEGHRGT